MRVETVFSLPELRRLRLPPGATECWWQFLSREVHRSPRILALHVCRIRIAATRGGDPLYAALVDLLGVLRNRGRPLQRRMILGSRRKLAPEHAAVLCSYLEQKIGWQALPFSPRSVLQQGAHGQTTGLVPRSRSRSPQPGELLEAARGCLEVGQLREACGLLEEVLERQPDNAAARRELFEILQATGDRDRLHRWHDRLEQQQGRLAAGRQPEGV